MWAWGLIATDHPKYENVEIGTDITSFIARVAKHNSNYYFHNLKFDGMFILDWLLKHGYRHVQSDAIKSEGTFKTLISDMGRFYSITVKWMNGNVTEFRDSLNKFNMPLSSVAKAFGMEVTKGTMDYDAHNGPITPITPEEEDYLRRDVLIVAKAMSESIANGATRLTAASDSLAEYKKVMGQDVFKRIFPTLSTYMDSEIRRAYRGGFTYADPRFRSSMQGNGLVLDVNSLYPSVMINHLLPHGEPHYVNGYVEPIATHPLIIFSVTFTAKLKPDHIPCIQIKGNSIFAATEYLSVITEPVTLMVTNVDWALYNDHYDIDVLAYGGGWRFHAARGLFDTYMDKWGAIKAVAVGGQRQIAKDRMNTLYGKFATNPNVTSKIPTLQDNAVKLVRGINDTRPPVYTAVGVFITSFARDLTIRSAQSNYGTFAYADTDSLHLLTDKVPDSIDVHPSKMGAWKLEYEFSQAFYIRPKGYMEKSTKYECKEDHEHRELCKFVTHIAGMPESITGKMTFDDIVDGKVFSGKLNPHTVPGGVVLKDIPYQLKL